MDPYTWRQTCPVYLTWKPGNPYLVSLTCHTGPEHVRCRDHAPQDRHFWARKSVSQLSMPEKYIADKARMWHSAKDRIRLGRKPNLESLHTEAESRETKECFIKKILQSVAFLLVGKMDTLVTICILDNVVKRWSWEMLPPQRPCGAFSTGLQHFSKREGEGERE